MSKLTYFGQGEAYEKKRKEMLVKLIWQGKISKSHFEPSSWICFQKIYLTSAYGFWEENFYKDFPYISPGNQGMYFFTKYYSFLVMRLLPLCEILFRIFFIWKVPDDRDLGPVRIEDIVNCEWTCIFVGKKNIHNVSSGLFSIHAEESKTKHSKIIDCFPKD